MTVDVLPCSARCEWDVLRAQVVRCTELSLVLKVSEAIWPDEQLLLKIRTPTLCVALYHVRRCQALDDPDLYEVEANFGGFVTCPANLNSRSLAALLGHLQNPATYTNAPASATSFERLARAVRLVSE